MKGVLRRSYAFFVLLASALIPLSAAATAAPLCSSSAARFSSYITGAPCISSSGRTLLIDATSAQPEDSSSRATQESSSALGAATTGPDSKAYSPHKPLVPVSKQDVAVFVLAGFVLFIAAGAGMGGGPVLMPIYLTLGAFTQQAAVALSNSTILAGSIANVLCNGRRRHPFKDRPLVDWDLILLMQPPTLLGAIAGSYINKLLPSWISHLLLAVLLTLMTVRVLQRAANVYKRESAALQPHSLTHAAAAAAGAQQQSITHPAAAIALVPQQELTAVPATRVVSCPLPRAYSNAAQSPGGSTGALQPSAAAGYVAGASPVTPANKLVRKLSARLPASAGSSAVKAPTSPFSTSSNSSNASPASAGGASSSRGGSSSTGGDAVVQLQLVTLQVPPAATLQPIADADAAASPLSVCSNSNRGDLYPSDDGSDTLAYAPPGHQRKNSWELQDGDWEADWEVWAAGESASTHSNKQQQRQQQKQLRAGSGKLLASVQLQPTNAAATGGATGASGLRCNASSGGGATDTRALLPPGITSSSSNLAAPQQQQQQHVISDVVGVRRRQPPPPELAGQSPAVQALLQAESKQLPLVPVLLICALFIAVLLTSLFSKLAGCGTLAFWLVQAAVAPALAVIFWAGRRRVLRKVAVKRAAQYDFHGDIRWTRKNSVLFPALCSLSGVIAGLFGLGGAAVLTPLMLELGVQPQVTAATSQTMLLLTSAASSITYAQMGDIPWPYAAVLMPVAFAATLAGQLALDALIRRLGRGGIVVMVLAGFFVIACGLTFYVAADSLRKVAVVGVVAATQPGRVCG